MSEELRKKGMYGAPPANSFSDDRRSAHPTPSDTAAGLASLNISSPPRKKTIMKAVDMEEEMQKEAIDLAITAFEKSNVDKEIAELIKKEFDKNHGPTWHCIVGRNFGSYVTHEAKNFIYFYFDTKAILLFKSG